MLCKLIIELENTKNLNYNSGSILHGFLMNNILPKELLEQYHRNALKKYSQRIYYKDGKTLWEITTLDKKTYEDIIIPLNDDKLRYLHLENKDREFKILNKEIYLIEKEKLFEEYFFRTDRYIKVQFKTPISFKKNGEYCFFPDIELVFKSLMNKYDSSNEDNKIYDEKTIDYIKDNVEIVNYYLKSTKFYLERTKIPSFIGNITMKINGSKNIVGLVHFLIKYGEFSAVGIKGSLGMGGIEYMERKKLNG